MTYITKFDLVKVISSFVKLEKCGNNYRGFSPFKKETFPSLMVCPKKNIWKDFSSGKSGTLIKFVMYYLNLNYIEAIKYLKNKYSKNKFINYSTNPIVKRRKNKKLYIYKIINIFNKYYNNLLKKNKIALQYLKNRGLKNKIIKIFSLGYSPNFYPLDFLTHKKIYYNNFILKNIGLFTKINKNFFYLFKNRIMFPIKNLEGNIIGFGGRTLNTYLKNKYINSPNNLIYNKSENLYGLYEAKTYILKKKFCYIVEGYMDLLSLYQNKIKNVISTLGTYINKIQIDLIKKFTNNVIVLFDGDETGINAAIKNINIFLKNNVNIRYFIFPQNKDPNTFILSKKKSNINFNLFFKKKSVNFIKLQQIKFKKLLYNGNPYKKYTFIKKILNNIQNIENGLIKEFYIQELIKEFNLQKSNIYEEIFKVKKNVNNITNKIQNTKNKFFIDINILIKKYKKLLILYLKKFKNFINYTFILKKRNKKNKIVNIKKILNFVIKTLNKYKILFFKKKNRLLLINIKKKLKNKTVYKKINYKNNIKNISNKKIIRDINEIILKYKYYLLLKNIKLYREKIKKNKKNNLLLYKIFFLTKKKNKIINKLYYL
ncbi:MAG: DNA primase [Candidatus Shikimatogenerans bostrichidophilus]|nr:MAG: DNA primase [Candidatus Shikimatogenerans bostrichidophilus]